MTALGEALRKRFRTPAEAVTALGLDAAILTQETQTVALSPQALMARRVLQNYLRPRLAQDARVDYDAILSGVTEKNWNPSEIARSVKQRVRSKLAQDADLTEIAKALAAVAPTLAGVDPGGDPVVAAVPPEVGGMSPQDVLPDALPVAMTPPNAGVPPVAPVAPVVPPVAAPPKAKDAGECESWLAQAYPDIAAEWQSKGGGGAPAPSDSAQDEDEEDINKPAADRTTGGANRARGKRGVTGDNEGPQMQPPDTKTPSIPGMDEAIKRERENQREIQKAQREVRPWVGDFALDMAFDTPADVYKKSLEILRVPTEGVHPTAFRPILQAQPKPGVTRSVPRPVAQDAGKGNGEGFLDRFPEARNATVG
jgi:hypothetical protein